MCSAHTHLFTLYFMDSGDYMGRTLPWEQHKYDYIKPYVCFIPLHCDPSSRLGTEYEAPATAE